MFNHVNNIKNLEELKPYLFPKCKWHAHKGNSFLNILMSYLPFYEHMHLL